MPSATIPTTVATGMRNPRMHGMPSICLGLTVMRVNFMALSSKDSAPNRAGPSRCDDFVPHEIQADQPRLSPVVEVAANGISHLVVKHGHGGSRRKDGLSDRARSQTSVRGVFHHGDDIVHRRGF